MTSSSINKFLWTPVKALWWRDVIRFLRQRNRIIGALATPLVFWLLLGSGFNPSFHQSNSHQESYLAYFFPGTIVLIMLFTAIFSTISLIEDRREGFLQTALVAPISHATLPLGKFLGGTTLAFLQALLFLALAPLASISLHWNQFLLVIPPFLLVGFSMTGLGFLVAWPLDSTQGFHAIMNIFLMPLWMMSGALFPMQGSGWLYWVHLFNPVSYGVYSLREALAPSALFSMNQYLSSLAITALFGLATFMLSYYLVAHPRKK